VEFQDLGYGSAAASLLFVMVTAATVLYLAATRGRTQESGS
jgi:ABC-type sugar transport system permease subunit